MEVNKENLGKKLLNEFTRKALLNKIREEGNIVLLREVKSIVESMYNEKPLLKRTFIRTGIKFKVRKGLAGIINEIKEIEEVAKVKNSIILAEPYWIVEKYRNGKEEINSLIDAYREIYERALKNMMKNGMNERKAVEEVVEMVERKMGIVYGEERKPYIEQTLKEMKNNILVDRIFMSQEERNRNRLPIAKEKIMEKRGIELKYIKIMLKNYKNLDEKSKVIVEERIRRIYYKNNGDEKIVSAVLSFGKKYKTFEDIAKIEINNKKAVIRKKATSILYEKYRDGILAALYSSSYVKQEGKKKKAEISYEKLREKWNKMEGNEKSFTIERIKLYLVQNDNEEIKLNAIKLVKELKIKELKEEIRNIIRNSKGRIFKESTYALMELCE